MLVIASYSLTAATQDAGTPPLDGGTAIQESSARADSCAAEEARIERRKAWLRERYKEQADRGMPNPKAGIPNMVAVYCESHAKDEECRLGAPPSDFHPDELSWEAQRTVEDRDPHVIALKRLLTECRKQRRR